MVYLQGEGKNYAWEQYGKTNDAQKFKIFKKGKKKDRQNMAGTGDV